MTDLKIQSNQSLCNNKGSELKFIPDEQLIRLAKTVRKEIKRRSHEKKTREVFLKNLEAHKRELDLPEKYFTIHGDNPHDVKSPKAFRKENLDSSPQERLRYLSVLLAQDWSFLWPQSDPIKKYCVYAHVDPKGKTVCFPKRLNLECRMPFYIGKGSVSRAFDLQRNQGHGLKIKQLMCEGYTHSDIVRVLSENLSEGDALELESKLIYFFGTIYEKDRSGVLLNLDTSLRPKFTINMAKRVKINQNAQKQFSEEKGVYANE